MAKSLIWMYGLTGGGTGALDSIDGNDIADDDAAIVIDATNGYGLLYHMNASSSDSESSPIYIAPDSNAGTKIWELQGIVQMYALIPESSTAPTTAANQGAVYTKALGGATALYFKLESDGTEIPISTCIVGDNSQGQVLRISRVTITGHAVNDADLVVASVWNGDTVASSQLDKGNNNADWALAAGGDEITIYCDSNGGSLSADVVAVFPSQAYNDAGDNGVMIQADVSAGDIVLGIYNDDAGSGAGYDVSGMAAGEYIEIDVLYITDA